MGKNVFMEKDKGKKRGKSSTLLTGSSLVLMQLMASSSPQQNVSAGFWDWLNPFNWNWAWIATLFPSLFGKSEQDAVSLSSADDSQKADNSQKNEGKMNKYIEGARKKLEKFYSKLSVTCENLVKFNKEILISDKNPRTTVSFWAEIEFDQEKNVYCFSSNLKKEKDEFEKGEDFIKCVKKYTKNMENVEKIIEQMKRISKTGRYSLEQGNYEVRLTLHNEEQHFCYEKNKELSKMVLNLGDMSIKLYQGSSIANSKDNYETCDLESLPGKVDFLLNSIEDDNKRCIETAKNCVDEVFGEANWKQDEEEKKWERSIEIEGINLPVSVETGSYYGSELYVRGKRLLGFSSNSEDSKTLYIEKIKEFKALFEGYAKKFMSFEDKGHFKPYFDHKNGRLGLVSNKPGYGVKVPGKMLCAEKDKLISKIEFDVLERKVYFWTDGKNTGDYDSMFMYEHFGQKNLGSEEEYPYDQKFTEFLDFLNSKELEEFKPQKEVEKDYSSGEESNE